MIDIPPADEWLKMENIHPWWPFISESMAAEIWVAAAELLARDQGVQP